jgi:glycosyltransferase involved in cell wall biosynthesis
MLSNTIGRKLSIKLKSLTMHNQSNTIPKLAIACSYFYPKIGGLEAIAYTTGKELHKSGEYEVCVITSNYDGKGYRKDIVDGMTVHRLPISFKISNTPINLFWYWQIKKILLQENVSIVHTHSPVPFMADVASKAAKDLGIPVVSTYHSGSMKKGSLLIDTIIGFYESYFLRKLFQRADAIVAVAKNFVQRVFPEFLDKTLFIPTGVDVQRFQKTPLPTETEIVTFVGRIEHTSKWKGIDQLLKAMSIVVKQRPQAQLALIGGGDAIDFYRNQAQELGIEDKVITPGAQYGEDLVNAYRRATVVVLPSTSDSEAFSVALVEAMASGRPVI